MVTHCFLNITNRKFTVGFDIKRHCLGTFTFYIRKVSFHRTVEHVEEAPYTGITSTQATEIQRTIRICKTEVLVQTVEISFFACKRNNIRRVKTIVFILHVKLADTALVSMCCDAVIRNTNGNPNGTFHFGAFTNHFHNPCLIRVGNRERLTAAVIAIFLNQVCHHLDCFLSSTRTLQSYVNQASVVHNTRRIYQLRTATKCSFGNGNLKFIHVADYVISLLCFLNLTQIFARIPVINIAHCSLFMLSCWIMIQIAEHTVRVGRIRYDNRTVGRGILAHNKVGTCPTFHYKGCKQQYSHHYFFHIHLFLLLIVVSFKMHTCGRSRSRRHLSPKAPAYVVLLSLFSPDPESPVYLFSVRTIQTYRQRTPCRLLFL